MKELDRTQDRDLVRRYADGELTIQELRAAGHVRNIELLSDLELLGRRPPLAEMVGPNVETRLAGIARLSAVLTP